MKNLVLSFLAIFATTMVFASTGDPVVKTINVETSTVEWKGYKVTGSHTGTIMVQSGTLSFDEAGSLTGGNFVIDMTSITNTDMAGKGGAAKLEGHLKSPDFFGVETHPTAAFEITKVVSRGTPGSYKIVGNLTIKETTKEIKFSADITENSAAAKIVLDRSDFNVKYGSGSFFDGLGDKTIYDEFDLMLNLAF